MVSFSKRYINIVSLIITIIIYFSGEYLLFKPTKNNFKFISILNLLKINKVQVEISSSNINQNTKEDEGININDHNIETYNNDIQNNQNFTPNYKNKTNDKKENWKIIIPSISLEAEISEGTRKEVIDQFVGHFEETAKINGNIGLAAHNRGYKVNYFTNLKNVKEGDEIKYQYKDIEKTYIVTKNIIIKDIDWSYLQNTEENKITLITCVDNEPNYRRCVQGIEK